MAESFWRDFVSLSSACLYWNDLSQTDNLEDLLKKNSSLKKGPSQKGKILTAKKMFDEFTLLATRKLLRFYGTDDDIWITPREFISAALARKYEPSPRAQHGIHNPMSCCT